MHDAVKRADGNLVTGLSSAGNYAAATCLSTAQTLRAPFILAGRATA